jgi:hypothetical protein
MCSAPAFHLLVVGTACKLCNTNTATTISACLPLVFHRRCAGIASSVGLPLIGNGDVFSPSEWNQRLSTAEGDDGGCGVTTAMIGRAALIKPWIFTGDAIADSLSFYSSDLTSSTST